MQATEWVLKNLQSSDSILDVGIGSGEIWNGTGHNVKGFDLDNKDPNVELTMGNICVGLPFQNKSFSVGVMINVLEALPESCKQHAVNELIRVSNSAIVVSTQPLHMYTNVPGVTHISDAVDGVQWFGALVNRHIAEPVSVTAPPEPKVEEPSSPEINEPLETDDETPETEEPKKKKPFWKRKSVKALRVVSVVVGALNFLKYLFSHETVTVPVEIASIVPIIGGTVTHYKVTMASYEAFMTAKNFFSKQ